MGTTPQTTRVGRFCAAAALLAFLLAASPAAAADDFGAGVAGCIRAVLTRPHKSRPAASRPGALFDAERLTAFYAGRRYRPLWVADSRVLPSARELLECIRRADREGLDPADYHLDDLAGLMRGPESVRNPAADPPADFGRWARLDLLLTDAFLGYAAHLTRGRINPRRFGGRRTASGPLPDPATALRTALDSGDVAGTLRSLAPPHAGYRRLKTALQRYRRIAADGGRPRIPDGEMLFPGDSSPRIPLLRQRLLASGDLDSLPTGDGGNRFNEALARALARFQRRHGLPATGTLDAPTLAELNVPVAARIHCIETNLERWRWAPRDLGRRHVEVNVPDFTLRVVEDGRTVLGMRVAVGKPRSPTPVFSSRITYLVINPTWNIPPRIAREDVLPRVQADPDYLADRRIHVFASWRSGAPEIDPRTIDWNAIRPARLTYKLQQEPGPLNELGRLKFMFPNRDAVYLHDTPDHSQFLRARRDLSSGCIRLEKPVELAARLLRDNRGWSRAHIEATIENGREMVVGLKRPIAIHLFYWTAWVDAGGILHFRKDIYGRDGAMARALHRPAPAGTVTTAGRDRHRGARSRF